MMVPRGELFLLNEVPLYGQSSGWAVQWEGGDCCWSTVFSRECLLCGEQLEKLVVWSGLERDMLAGAAFFALRYMFQQVDWV